jgi:CheY-like chemotaxis protein
MKILSVDDKAENLYMLEALLKGYGHDVDSASNGLQALQLAERGRYDLIVSDILMPRMDGFQLCRELK